MATPPSRRLIFLLSAANRRVQRWIEADRGGMTSAQAGVLFFLGRADGALMGEAAAALDAAPSAMSGLIDRMERSGLVERRPDLEDGRAQRLWLTEQGRKARGQAVSNLDGLNRKMTEGFSEAELDIIARWLSGLQTQFSNRSVSGEEQ